MQRFESKMNMSVHPVFPGAAVAVAYSCLAGSCVPFYISPAVEQLTGHKREEFGACPQLWLNVVIEEDRRRVIEGLAALMRHGTHELDYRIRRADGAVRRVRSITRVIQGAASRPVRIEGVVADITESFRAAGPGSGQPAVDRPSALHTAEGLARSSAVTATPPGPLYQLNPVIG